MWHDEISHLTCWTKQFGGGRGKLQGKEKEREKREKMRERLLIFSSFPEDPTLSVRRSKRQSSSSRRELRVETELGSLDKLQDCRGFSNSVFIHSLKSI